MKRIFIILIVMTAGLFPAIAENPCGSVKIVYKLHGQTRRFNVSFCRCNDGSMVMSWEIMRNLKMWRGSYTMTREALERGTDLSYLMPEDGNHVTLPDGETFAILSQQSLKELVDTGHLTLNGIEWTLTSSPQAPILEAESRKWRANMTVANDPTLPLVTSMTGNPLEINWTATKSPTPL